MVNKSNGYSTRSRLHLHASAKTHTLCVVLPLCTGQALCKRHQNAHPSMVGSLTCNYTYASSKYLGTCTDARSRDISAFHRGHAPILHIRRKSTVPTAYQWHHNLYALRPAHPYHPSHHQTPVATMLFPIWHGCCAISGQHGESRPPVHPISPIDRAFDYQSCVKMADSSRIRRG
jgi:hypothetical protein